MEQRKKTTGNYFESVKQDIIDLYRTPEEIERVRKIFDEAEIQTREKRIVRLRKPNRLKKFRVRWIIRIKYGIHWKKKYFVARLLRNYVLTSIYRILGIRKYVFRGIEFGLTYSCNFRCHHCLCARIDETETRKELEPEEYERVVKEAMKLGALTFGLEGGEPFMARRWEDMVRAMKPRINHIVASSNGFMFDEKLAEKCARLGIDTVNFSLDSGFPELHDVFRRRRGSFERVIRAIDLCHKHKIKVIINTVVCRSNLYTRGLLRLFEYAEDKKILINVLFAKGVGSFKDKNEMLSAEDIDAFYRLAEPYNYWHIHHMGHLKSNHGGEGCSGVKEFVNMTPYGDVINCANNHIYLGNVREESFAAIRQRALKETPFGKYRPCFLTMDRDFMNIYYPLLEEKIWITVTEFRDALRRYEEENHRVVYPELR